VTVRKLLDPARQLQFDVDVPAALDEVWAALTTADGMKTWIAPDARVDLRPGGDWLVLFPGGPPGGGTITAFTAPTRLILQALAPSRFPDVRARGTEATFTLTPCGPQCTHVRLDQTGWLTGKEWDAAFEYLADGNADLLEQLHRRFLDGPRQWTASGPNRPQEERLVVEADRLAGRPVPDEELT
jgi:uncharacterized protein YndB with AHSA1/START domain